MYRFSDSDSVDSDKGIRYKTDSIRNKDKSSDRDLLSKRDSIYRKGRMRSRSKSRSRYHDQSRKKLKKQKREYSSEDEDEEHRTKSKGRKKDVRRHREREGIRKALYIDKKNKSRDQFTESSKSEKKYNIDLNEKSVVDMAPALSLHLTQKDRSNLDEKSNRNLEKSYKFKLFSVNEVGPSFQPDFRPKLSNNFLTSGEHEKDSYGPSLPPNFKQKLPDLQLDKTIDPIVSPDLPFDMKEEITSLDKSEMKLIGPTLPPHIQQKLVENNLNELERKTLSSAHAPLDLPPADEFEYRSIEPALPPGLKEKLLEDNSYIEDDEVYGPIPVGELFSKAHIELEERALKIKIDQLGPQDEKQPTREEWMLTLPEARSAKFGLGPRSFRAKAGPDLSDRSSWTDTPEDKARKKAGKVEPKIDLQKEAKIKEIQRKDKEQEVLAKKSRKHKESLLEMHQNQQKNKNSASGPSERRPFSREIDLQVNRFDEAQKKAVLKKAQLLDTRFSAGESKYL